LHLEIHCSTQDGWTVLTPFGDLDMAGAPGFRQAVVREVGEGRNQLVVDLSAVTFLDSSGLGAIIGGLHALEPMVAIWSSYVPTPKSGEPSNCAISTESSTSTPT